MDYRTRFINTIRGEPVDRLPFVETAQYNMVRPCSDWDNYLRKDDDPLALFGFDNVGAPMGYELVPIDWYAIPRFEEKKLPSDKGQRRFVEGRFGKVEKVLIQTPENPLYIRVFEDHFVRTRDNWLEARKRFRLSTEERFPENWDAWCEHSRTTRHPIVLNIYDATAAVMNLLGEQGETGLFVSFCERPELVREMVAHFSHLARLCAEKALKEARIDMVSIGGDALPLIGPNFLREFFADATARNITLAQSHGIDLIMLEARGNILPLIDLYRDCGVNGLNYVMEIGGDDYLEELLGKYGDSMFFIGCMDGRVLLKDFEHIEREVDRKIRLARRFRIIPSLHATHVLPDVPYAHYKHYAEYLRNIIMKISD